jgi:hypothetical protein
MACRPIQFVIRRNTAAEEGDGLKPAHPSVSKLQHALRPQLRDRFRTGIQTRSAMGGWPVGEGVLGFVGGPAPLRPWANRTSPVAPVSARLTSAASFTFRQQGYARRSLIRLGNMQRLHTAWRTWPSFRRPCSRAMISSRIGQLERGRVSKHSSQGRFRPSADDDAWIA